MAVVTLGELMLRLSPPGHERLSHARRFDASYGGSEANVAVSLAHLGTASRVITRVPDSPLGDAAVASLRAEGVDVSAILRGGTRLGVYYLEHGASVRPSRVVYDRAGSAIAELPPGAIDWPAAFENATWFHVSGITPALSPACADAAMYGARYARSHGVPVSVDLNYRKNLWTREEAGRVLGTLVREADLLIGNEEDAADVFGIHADRSSVRDGLLDTDAYVAVARELRALSGASRVAITLRESFSASDNIWSALLLDGDTPHVSRKIALHIIDRVGAGDAFAAGLIHALLRAMPVADALAFAVAASALAHTVPGDWNTASEAEVLALAHGDAGGRVQR